jgi:glycosyltransferase involved in cell wall biosynthesis
MAKNVYFFTGNFTHTFYKEQYKHVPNGFEYVPSTPELIDDGMKKDIAKSKGWWGRNRYWFEHQFVKLLDFSSRPNIKNIDVPDGIDLIHSAQAVLRNTEPWVVDFEDISVFTWYSRKVLGKPRAKRRLEKLFASDACRLLLPWTEAAKKSLLNGLDCDSFKDKIEVAYPARQPKERPQLKTKKNGEPIELLMIGTAFYEKGAYDTILAVDRLSKTHNVHLTMISYVPDEIKAKYADHPAMTFLSRVPNERITQAYREADMFVYPVHTDTFGYVLLEAYSYGVPCVANDQFAIPEIIEEGVTGLLNPTNICRFGEDYLPQYDRTSSNVPDSNHPLVKLIKQPEDSYIDGLAERIAKVADDEALRHRMAEAAYESVASGRFSVKARKERMERLYKRALD